MVVRMDEEFGLIELWKVARALRWNRWRTRRWFTRVGWVVQMPGGHEMFMTRAGLHAKLPSVLAKIDALEAAGKLKSRRGRRRNSDRGHGGKFTAAQEPPGPDGK